MLAAWHEQFQLYKYNFYTRSIFYEPKPEFNVYIGIGCGKAKLLARCRKEGPGSLKKKL